MGATTYAEHRNIFEKDKALSRRFAKIDVDEPSFEDTFLILKGLKSKYEEHHHVTYPDKTLKCAIELSKRYISDRFLPDVAIDVIDEVGAAIQIQVDHGTQFGLGLFHFALGGFGLQLHRLEGGVKVAGRVKHLNQALRLGCACKSHAHGRDQGQGAKQFHELLSL
jgi:hypothetical protein